MEQKWNNDPTAASSSLDPPWIELPRDVTANILRRLGPAEILDTAERVCATWRSASAEPFLWQVIHMSYTNTFFPFGRADILCRRAVDRSQGELIDISIQDFGTDDLLHYISQRSRNLKILSLESCECISPGGLTTAVRNFPHLEELHLFFPQIISGLDIDTIGVSCPMMKSFTFNCPFSDAFGSLVTIGGIIDNSHALSIAKNMPNLQSLRLVGNLLSNEGLLAILDGCPNLELLDLLRCFRVDLKCDGLGRKCSEQVKKLRGPFDFSGDCEWDARVYDVRVEDDFNDDYSDGYSLGDVDSDYGDDGLYDADDDYGFF